MAKPIKELTQVLIRLKDNQEGQNVTVFDKQGWLKKTYFGVNILRGNHDFGAQEAIEKRLNGDVKAIAPSHELPDGVKGGSYFAGLRGRVSFADARLADGKTHAEQHCIACLMNDVAAGRLQLEAGDCIQIQGKKIACSACRDVITRFTRAMRAGYEVFVSSLEPLTSAGEQNDPHDVTSISANPGLNAAFLQAWLNP